MPENGRQRLDSWGEIAQYLRRDIRTVKRWEKEKGLPVHRLPGGKRQVVFAYQDEIDLWASSSAEKNPSPVSASSLLTDPSLIPAGTRVAVQGEPSAQVAAALEEIPQSSGDSSATPFYSSTPVTVPYPAKPPFLNRRWNAALGLAALAIVAFTAVLAARAGGPQLRVARYNQLTHETRYTVGQPVFTDGARLYYIQRTPQGETLAAVAVAGGGSATIPCDCTNDSVFDLSPMRSELLLGKPTSINAGALWVMPLLGGSPRRVGDLNANAANWSRDGKRLVFALGSKLFIANADGTEAREVAKVPGQAQWLRWSPDGKIIRFTVDNYTKGEMLESIWEMRTDGTGLHQLLAGWNGPGHECCGVWTPDGEFYIFESMHEDQANLWAISEKPSFFGQRDDSPIQLSSGLQGGYSHPVMSVDGRQIFAIGNQRQGELVRFDPRVEEFVPFLGGISAMWAVFSNSGKYVAYIAYPDKTVWRANADGSEKKQLTFSPTQVEGLDWSPDDKWLALRARVPDKPWLMYLIPAEGRVEPQPLLPSEKEQGIPSWSPDGKTIAFGDVSPVFDSTNGTDAIHVIDVQSRRVTDIPGSRGLWTARWSPDGRSMAALTMVGQRVMLYDIESKTWRQTEAVKVNNPSWSKDSQYIYFDTEGENRSLRRIRVADGKMDYLAGLSDYPNMAWGWSGLAPDNSPLVLRNLDSLNIYALTLERK